MARTARSRTPASTASNGVTCVAQHVRKAVYKSWIVIKLDFYIIYSGYESKDNKVFVDVVENHLNLYICVKV